MSEEKAINYHAKFVIATAACGYPTVTVYYQNTDFKSFANETNFLTIYFEGFVIGQCQNINTGCDNYQYCLNNYPLPVDAVKDGESITIKVVKARNSTNSEGCLYSLYADVTVSCTGTIGI